MSANPQMQRATPARPGELRRIEGITPAIEGRLHEAGITTFAQLAEARPEFLAEVLRPIGAVTTRRVVQQGWIAAARALAAESSPFALSRPELQNEGFVVDLFLDVNREVQLTQVLHVKSAAGESWQGWDAERLLGFFRRNSQLPETKPPALSSDPLDLRGIEIHSSQGRPIARCDEPLNAQFVFDLNKPFRASTRPLTYQAEIRARSSKGDRIILAQAEGELDPLSESLELTVPPGLLNPGLYRIRGTLTVTRPGSTREKAFTKTTSLPGGILRIM
jgi:hypothetical protein